MPSKPPGAHAAAKAAKPPQAPAPQPAQPRLRVLAGPNGSGKSTIKPDLKPQWIGVFVNADEMERDLVASVGFLSLRSLGVSGEPAVVLKRIKKSLETFGLEKRLAASLADAVRQELLEAGQTFTFETVMSHPSKIEFMRQARERGYRVYLYFVATDDPAINIDRVHRRVLQGGHPVKDELVVSRYHRSIALMTEACKVAHRAYIFDNSGTKHKLLAEVTDFEEIRLEASRISPWFLETELWKQFS